jgi:hypothetical protein
MLKGHSLFQIATDLLKAILSIANLTQSIHRVRK